MKKKALTLIFLAAAAIILAVQMGCNDGGHAGRPSWSNGGGGSLGAGSGFSEGADIAGIECVDVTNYRNIDADEIAQYTEEEEDAEAPPAAEETPATEEEETPATTAGEVTNENHENPFATRAMRALIAPVATPSTTDATTTIHRCIRAEIRGLEECGPSCRTYWGGGRWLLLREKPDKKPKKSEVDVVRFTDCEQIRLADCLLVN